MKISKFSIAVLLLVFVPLFLFSAQSGKTEINSYKGIVHSLTADHHKFPISQKKFNSPEEVTQACLSCHTEAASQVQQTIHWKWQCPKSGDKNLGKHYGINNFCISIQANEPRCTSCHAGYGWKNKSFDFSSERNVDCLVCHDQTGTYEKFPSSAGYAVTKEKKSGNKTWLPPDYNKIAQNIARPKRENCGSCHFYGGGGDNIKHGDLSSAMVNPDFNLDVHMDHKGLNFACTTCHTTHNHKIAGRCYSHAAYKDCSKFHLPLKDDKKIACASCHGLTPHNKKKLNDHIDKIACQTCHIPKYAKEKPTKLSWDWSKAGKFDEDGKMINSEGEYGKHNYMTMKGEFTWGKNVEPEYFWFNGTIANTTIETKINPDSVVEINILHGSYNDPYAKIWPFKVHRGKQVYDSEYNNLVYPKLFGPKGSGAYWKDFDWQKSITEGMKYAGKKYSGKYGFVETKMYWVISHQVAPKDQALKCQDCHSPNGRLENLSGFYMPGRPADHHSEVELIGKLLFVLTLLGVLIHGVIRVVMSLRQGRKS
jgi:octaheme c-type cytochrome (tetrathionate reductase family)